MSEGFLDRFRSAKCSSDPEAAEIMGHHLCALSPFLKYIPSKISDVVKKIFEFLFMIPRSTKVHLNTYLFFEFNLSTFDGT